MWKVDQVLQIFAPFDCLGCQKEGALLCRDCIVNCLPPAPDSCYKCRQPAQQALCEVCRPHPTLLSVNVSTAYKGVSQQLVGRLKFERTQAAAYIIGRIMDRRLPIYKDYVVVHVPTVAQRVRQRGYDQAQLIARELARSRHLPYQSLLRRHGKTRQVGANRQERLQQLQHAYYCPNPQLVAGKKVLLVDDVLTTGATIEVASRVLKENGAKEVRAVLFAQKI
ncbi:MAG: phosphoribosyltransferase family protein [Candidatus Saccharimonadales bacterium]